ncbi:MAG: hypothetical protein AAFP81_13465 [Pseudomonadota bacterium]
MASARLFVQDMFCATWLSKAVPTRSEIARALNHRSHRRWMAQYLERKSELAKLNLWVAMSIVPLWLKHHINFRMRQMMNGAWAATPALAIDHARAALKHHDRSVREDGLAILAYFGDAPSLEPIRALFDHTDPQTRYRAQLAARAIEREMPILFVAPNFNR